MTEPAKPRCNRIESANVAVRNRDVGGFRRSVLRDRSGTERIRRLLSLSVNLSLCFAGVERGTRSSELRATCAHLRSAQPSLWPSPVYLFEYQIGDGRNQCCHNGHRVQQIAPPDGGTLRNVQHVVRQQRYVAVFRRQNPLQIHWNLRSTRGV